MTPKTIRKLKALKFDIQDSWRVACLHDGIATLSHFVVFSKDNPAAIRHNKLMGEYFKILNRVKNSDARTNAPLGVL